MGYNQGEMLYFLGFGNYCELQKLEEDEVKKLLFDSKTQQSG